MRMAMVNIGKVWMLMHHSGMRMLMGMSRAGRNLERMIVPMVLVMPVAVGMAQRLVSMFMIVPFREMQQDAEQHQQAGDHQLQA